MGHLGKLSDDRLTADTFAEAKRQAIIGRLESAGVDHFAQVNGFTIGVRQFDADHVTARNHGHAG